MKHAEGADGTAITDLPDDVLARIFSAVPLEVRTSEVRWT